MQTDGLSLIRRRSFCDQHSTGSLQPYFASIRGTRDPGIGQLALKHLF